MLHRRLPWQQWCCAHNTAVAVATGAGVTRRPGRVVFDPTFEYVPFTVKENIAQVSQSHREAFGEAACSSATLFSQKQNGGRWLRCGGQILGRKLGVSAAMQKFSFGSHVW